MNPVQKITQTKISSPMLSGLIYAWITLALSALFISILLMASGMKENSMAMYVYAVHGFAAFVGGFVCGKRAARKGWYWGAVLGALYAAIHTLVAFLAFDTKLDKDIGILFAIAVLVSCLGGMLGVNARK